MASIIQICTEVKFVIESKERIKNDNTGKKKESAAAECEDFLSVDWMPSMRIDEFKNSVQLTQNTVANKGKTVFYVLGKAHILH